MDAILGYRRLGELIVRQGHDADLDRERIGRAASDYLDLRKRDWLHASDADLHRFAAAFSTAATFRERRRA